MTISTNISPPTLPLVIHVGFAGARVLFDANTHPGIDETAVVNATRTALTQCLLDLPHELKIPTPYFFCGLSQLAIGADTLFTQAIAEMNTQSLSEFNWYQRLLLPQHREEFLAALGSSGQPDFTDEQRAQALALFDSPTIIHELVVGHSPHRHSRFHEVNQELLRISDVLICLVNADAEAGKSGGTRELINAALAAKKPLLELRLTLDEAGNPVLFKHWHNKHGFKLPCLPNELAGLATVLTGIPTTNDYCQVLKAFASRLSSHKQRWFKFSALTIIVAHIAATGLAVAGLISHHGPWFFTLLLLEFLFLLVGFITHQYLHHSHAPKVWAMTRLVAEIARSVSAVDAVPGYLAHLFKLPFPSSLKPLLRTLNVLHLRDTHTLAEETWQQRRDAYIQQRFDDAAKGQLHYYQKQLRSAENWHGRANKAFLIGSGSAIVATLCELLLLFHLLPVCESWQHGLDIVLGPLAIIMPVIAVAALSLAAAFDLDAHIHTYKEMLAFLDAQQQHLYAVVHETAFYAAAMETESRLLSETAAWYTRRAFTGVS